MRNHIEILSKIKPYKKEINISSDKSISIRSVLLASQAIGKSRLYNLLESEDVMNTLKSISKLGIKYKKLKNIDLKIQNLISDLPRQFLHAKTLGFIHPKNNKKMHFSSNLPHELNIILEMLRNTNK